jgi:hypothetical protein
MRSTAFMFCSFCANCDTAVLKNWTMLSVYDKTTASSSDTLTSDKDAGRTAGFRGLDGVAEAGAEEGDSEN